MGRQLSDETGDDRLRQLADELASIQRRVAEIQQELEQNQGPGERRRRFYLIPGGLAALGATGAAVRWARENWKPATATAAAAGGAGVLAAGLLTHPAPQPPTAQPPPPVVVTTVPMTPTAAVIPTAHPSPGRPRPSVPPVLPPPVRRRTAPAVPVAAPTSPAGPPPAPPTSPAPSSIPAPSASPTPPPGTTPPVPARVCLLRAEVSIGVPILWLCI